LIDIVLILGSISTGLGLILQSKIIISPGILINIIFLNAIIKGNNKKNDFKAFILQEIPIIISILSFNYSITLYNK
jgi:hypothetical protein